MRSRRKTRESFASRLKRGLCLEMDDDRKTLKVSYRRGFDAVSQPRFISGIQCTRIYPRDYSMAAALFRPTWPAKRALFADDRGTPDRIFFDGEEVTDAASARAWARTSRASRGERPWQLPLFGRMPFENVVACPHAQNKNDSRAPR